MLRKVIDVSTFALIATFFLSGSSATLAQHQNAGPVFRGIDNARSIPGCKIVKLVNGESLVWNGQPVSVGGTCSPIEMQQRGNSVPPIVGPDRGRENPNCRIIRLRDGSALTYRGTTVTVGGTCPAGYFRGSIVDKWTFRVQANGELRTCRMNEHMQFWC